MRVRRELAAAVVEPALARAVAEVLPDRVRIPVLALLRHEVAALEDEDARRVLRQRLRHRAAAGAGADNDDVVVLVHCGALGVVTRVLSELYNPRGTIRAAASHDDDEDQEHAENNRTLECAAGRRAGLPSRPGLRTCGLALSGPTRRT